MWMTSCAGSAGGGFWGLWKSQLSWFLRSEEEGWLSLACRSQTSGLVVGAARKWNRKNVYLSPYVEEPLNSKVIKSFVPEPRSRKCFSCFGIPMFYVYMLWTLWTMYICYEHSMYVSRIHIWLCYTTPQETDPYLYVWCRSNNKYLYNFSGGCVR